jgi:uncharacterized protein (DUF1684 family)
MNSPDLKNRKRFFLSIFSLSLFLLFQNPALSLPGEDLDPMERREEKLKAFREKRDRFFKEDHGSPLKELDRNRFKGLSYYPIDLKYAIVGAIERYPSEPKPLYVNLPTTDKGKEKKYVKYGRFRFRWEGRECALQIYRPLGGGELFLPFKDKTSETETHSGGRYLHIEQMPRGKVLIDFNRASNPFCEFNKKYTCTLAPEENWLGIAIRSGEKRFLK